MLPQPSKRGRGHPVVYTDRLFLKAGVLMIVRHPSYTGFLITLLELGLSSTNWLSLLVLMGCALIGLSYRIHVEEHVLKAHLGQRYQEYMRRTKRLIPSCSRGARLGNGMRSSSAFLLDEGLPPLNLCIICAVSSGDASSFWSDLFTTFHADTPVVERLAQVLSSGHLPRVNQR